MGLAPEEDEEQRGEKGEDDNPVGEDQSIAPVDELAGEEAVAEMGEAVLGMDGCPMSEHGVGRDPVKQKLLRALYGEEGIAQMRATRRALDPEGKLSPGVLFP